MFALKTRIMAAHVHLRLTPTADMGLGLRHRREGRQGHRHGGQTDEAGLIGPQKAIKSPSALPENVNKVMVDKDQTGCVTKLLKTETSASAARQRARASPSSSSSLIYALPPLLNYLIENHFSAFLFCTLKTAGGVSLSTKARRCGCCATV